MSKLKDNLVFDLEAIRNFIFKEDTEIEKTRDSEITDTYGLDESNNKQVLLSRVIHEVKGSDFNNKQTIRYDLIKMFIDILDNVEMDTDLSPLSLGQQTVLNTMINYELIKEVK